MTDQPILIEQPTDPAVAVQTDQPGPDIEAPPGGRVIVLPSGFRVAVRNPGTIRNRERKYVYEVAAGATEANAVDVGFRMTDRITALLISAWDVRSVDDNLVPYGPVLPIPREDMSGLEDLPLSDMNLLDEAAEAARKVIMPDFTPSPDPTSPTTPSGG